jgi:hypothetical protein
VIHLNVNLCSIITSCSHPSKKLRISTVLENEFLFSAFFLDIVAHHHSQYGRKLSQIWLIDKGTVVNINNNLNHRLSKRKQSE